MQQGTLWVLSAPSGTGKTSLVHAVCQRDPRVTVAISYTTRPPRAGEINGVHYHFVAPERFQEMVGSDAFLEHAVVFGYGYGTARAAVTETLGSGHDVLLEIDYQGACQIAARVACHRILLLPPSRAALEARLTARGTEDSTVRARRLAMLATEVGHYALYDYLVVNSDFQQALEDLLALFRAQRLHHSRQLPALLPLLEALQVGETSGRL